MTQLGKYELHEQLGKGGFGTVYRATDLSLDRVVALKILHPQMAADIEFVERFRKEARLAAALESPNVLTIYEVGDQDGRYYIAMRYYPGGSLADLLKAGPLSWDRARHILRQVCAGVQKLHSKDWLHRDLKPSNILFDDEGQAVIADFGLVRALSGSTSSSTSTGAGTPFYRAPELWNGKPPASPATDVYALGCILGEMLTGKPLFAGETPEEVLTRHLVHGPDFGEDWPPAGAPEAVAGFVQRCLSKSPDDRPANAAEFFRELQETEPKPVAIVTEKAAPPPPIREAPVRHETREQPITGLDAPQKTPAPVEEIQQVQRKPRLPVWAWAALGALGAGLLIGGITLLARMGTNAQPPASPLTQTATAEVPVSTSTLAATPSTAPSFTPTVTATFTPAATLTITPTATLQAGAAQISEIDGMVMLYVPAGEFLMGSDKSVDPKADNSELPHHTVYLDAYWIDQTEVTNAMYSLCVSAGTCTPPGDAGSYTRSFYFKSSQFATYPVIHVNWEQARTYCEWAGRRLPTEAEWEKAARGTDGRIYPWGNDPPAGDRMNIADNNTYLYWRDTTIDDGYADTSPAGAYPAGTSPYGALDMAGNVLEWTADWFSKSAYDSSPATNPTGPEAGQFRALRGGAWDTVPHNARAAGRTFTDPGSQINDLGIRCAQSADTP